MLAHARDDGPEAGPRPPELLALYDAHGKAHTFGVTAARAPGGAALTLRLEHTRLVNPEAAEDAGEGVAKVTLAGGSLAVSLATREFAALFGVAPEHVVGRALGDVLWAEGARVATWDALVAGARGGKRMHGQMLARHARGHTLLVDVVVSPRLNRPAPGFAPTRRPAVFSDDLPPQWLQGLSGRRARPARHRRAPCRPPTPPPRCRRVRTGAGGAEGAGRETCCHTSCYEASYEASCCLTKLHVV